MLPVKIYAEFRDADIYTVIDTEVVVRPRKGDQFRFGKFDTELPDNTIEEIADAVNESIAAESYLGRIENKGPVSNYREDVLNFLDFAVWKVTDTIVCCKYVEVFMELIPGNPDYKRR